MRIRRPVAAVVAVLLSTLGVVGCGEDPPVAKPSASPPASVAPSPTGPAAPELPADAKREDDVGAKAFIKFYFQALTYAMQSGDTAVMEEYAGDDCEACRGISRQVRKLYAGGGRNEGGGWSVEQLDLLPKSGGRVEQALVMVTQAAQTHIKPSGARGNQDPSTQFAFEVWVSPRDDGWMMREIRKVKGTY